MNKLIIISLILLSQIVKCGINVNYTFYEYKLGLDSIPVYLESHTYPHYECVDRAIGNDTWKTMVFYTGSNILNGVGDGLKADNKYPVLAHSAEATHILCLITYPMTTNIKKEKALWYVLSYSLVRAAVFDLSYNYVRGLPVNHVSDVSMWDKGVNFISGGRGFGYLHRAVFLGFGYGIILNKNL